MGRTPSGASQRREHIALLLFLSAIRSSERALCVSARGPPDVEDADEDAEPVDAVSDAAEVARPRPLSPSAGASPLASWIVSVRPMPKGGRAADAPASSELCPNAEPATRTPSACVPTIVLYILFLLLVLVVCVRPTPRCPGVGNDVAVARELG